MIGLEFILKLNDISQREVANKLGIKQQNIDLWIRGNRKIPNKHLLLLSEEFNLEIGFFQNELNEIERLKLQKLKLIDDCNKIGLKLEEL